MVQPADWVRFWLFWSSWFCWAEYKEVRWEIVGAPKAFGTRGRVPMAPFGEGSRTGRGDAVPASGNGPTLLNFGKYLK
jgi:hypothetical protein